MHRARAQQRKGGSRAVRAAEARKVADSHQSSRQRAAVAVVLLLPQQRAALRVTAPERKAEQFDVLHLGRAEGAHRRRSRRSLRRRRGRRNRRRC